jgi:hypothetical protein
VVNAPLISVRAPFDGAIVRDSPRLAAPGGQFGPGVRFELPPGPMRDRLIQRLFSDDLPVALTRRNDAPLTWMLLKRLLVPVAATGAGHPSEIREKAAAETPGWLAARVADATFGPDNWTDEAPAGSRSA